MKWSKEVMSWPLAPLHIHLIDDLLEMIVLSCEVMRRDDVPKYHIGEQAKKKCA